MIDYLEIRNGNLELIGICDNVASAIWHSRYYGVGDFEIYLSCAAETVSLLSVGNYVTRRNDREIGIIERVEITYSANEGRMIVASGRFAKSLLDRRVIYTLDGNTVNPRILSGNVETAVRSLVEENAINCAFDSARNIPILKLGEAAGIPYAIVDGAGDDSEKQVTYKELLDYTDSFLQEYALGAYVALDENDMKLSYNVFDGVNRSIDNTDGNEPVIFSTDFDNLLTSHYQKETSSEKNTAIIGGAGEGIERFVCLYKKATDSGINRKEVFIDASNNSRKYKDADGVEQIIPDAEYQKQLVSVGKQNLEKYTVTETLAGDIDIANSAWQYLTHFNLGDIVSLQDVGIGLYINARVTGIIESQDESGYKIEGEFGV